MSFGHIVNSSNAHLYSKSAIAAVEPGKKSPQPVDTMKIAKLHWKHYPTLVQYDKANQSVRIDNNVDLSVQMTDKIWWHTVVVPEKMSMRRVITLLIQYVNAEPTKMAITFIIGANRKVHIRERSGTFASYIQDRLYTQPTRKHTKKKNQSA
jgi:hypothetical protein